MLKHLKPKPLSENKKTTQPLRPKTSSNKNDKQPKVVFEAYEDDFEDFSETDSHSLIVDIKKAVAETMPKLTKINDTSTIELPKQKMMNISESHKLNSARKAAHKNRQKRINDLKNLIQLDFCVYEIFELSVLNEYELYIRNYGSSNCIQTFTQTNNEIASQESQTDELIISEKWSQCPPHLLLESGDSISGSLVKLDSFLLSDFIVKSANAIECLLDEEKEFEIDEMEDFETKLHFKKNILIPEYLIGHEIVDLIVLPNSKKKIIVCWSSEAFEDIEGCKSILLLIDLQHEKVQVYMKCLARVTTLNCSEARPNLLFAGTENGSIQLWDLNESEKDHTFCTKGMIKRWPSFITDSIVGADYGHCSPIIRIHQRPSNDNKFQLITIEQLGYCQSWIVLPFSGFDSGQSVCSNYKMVKGEQLKFPRQQKFKSNNFNCAKVTKDSSIYIGTDNETVINLKKGKQPSYPMRLTKLASYNPVTCIELSNQNQELFAVGYEDGTVCIFTKSFNEPRIKWDLSTKVIQILWSPYRIGVIFALDSNGIIYLWDLMESSSNYIEKFEFDKVTKMSFLSSSLVIAFQNGTVSMYDMNSGLVEQWENETIEIEKLFGLSQ